MLGCSSKKQLIQLFVIKLVCWTQVKGLKFKLQRQTNSFQNWPCNIPVKLYNFASSCTIYMDIEIRSYVR